MTSTKKGLEYRQNIKTYLSELALLTNKELNEDDILYSPLSVENARQRSSSLSEFPILKFTIPFSEKKSERFSLYIDNLYQKNSSNVYIWTQRTNICGLYEVESIKKINFDFPFSINNEGILVLLSTDFEDKLLFDFSLNSDGDEIVEVEAQGKNWSRLKF